MIIKALILVLSLTAVALGGGYLTGDLQRFFEHESPTIIDPELPAGIGSVATEVKIVAVDTQAGMDTIVLRTISGSRRSEIAEKQCDGEIQCTLKVKLSADILNSRKGDVTLEVVAFDRSYFSNRSSREFTVLIDTVLPTLDIVSSQHNLREGGSQLVIYQTRDSNLGRSGVRTGSDFYLGSSADRCSDKIPSKRSLACVLFSRRSNQPKPVLFSEDKVGNLTELGFYNKFFKRRPAPARTSISSSWLERAAEGCMEDAACVTKKIDSEWLAAMEGVRSGVAMAKVVHPQLEATPWEIPSGTFIGTFGTLQQLNLNSVPVGVRELYGYEITGTSAVPAAQRGTVVQVGRFGPLGLSVVMHHGLNLYSLYGFLSESLVSLGQVVEKGAVLGKAGQSGIGRLDGYFITALLDARTPVDPNEWWSKDWLSVHINGKIAEASRLAATLPTVSNYNSEGVKQLEVSPEP